MFAARDELGALIKAALFELEQFGVTDEEGPATLSPGEVRHIEPVLQTFRVADDAGELDALDQDDRAVLETDMVTLEAQSRSPRPKRRSVREALASARSIAESVAAAGLVVVIDRALSAL